MLAKSASCDRKPGETMMMTPLRNAISKKKQIFINYQHRKIHKLVCTARKARAACCGCVARGRAA